MYWQAFETYGMLTLVAEPAVHALDLASHPRDIALELLLL
jgi:hypothetical protein